MKTKTLKTKVVNMANTTKQHIKDHAVDYTFAGVALGIQLLVVCKLSDENKKLIIDGKRRENTAYLAGLRDGYTNTPTKDEE